MLPIDAVYWLGRALQPIPLGQRRVGAVYGPNALNGRQGEALATRVRVRYRLNEAPVDEDSYTFCAAARSVPYSGPQGQDAEFHRHLLSSMQQQRADATRRTAVNSESCCPTWQRMGTAR